MQELICSENKDQGRKRREKGIIMGLRISFYIYELQTHKNKTGFAFL